MCIVFSALYYAFTDIRVAAVDEADLLCGSG
jgi:hypothetical protein